MLDEVFSKELSDTIYPCEEAKNLIKVSEFDQNIRPAPSCYWFMWCLEKNQGKLACFKNLFEKILDYREENCNCPRS